MSKLGIAEDCYPLPHDGACAAPPTSIVAVPLERMPDTGAPEAAPGLTVLALALVMCGVAILLMLWQFRRWDKGLPQG